MIDIQGLGWRFDGTQDWALRGVDLHIDRGELVVVTGPSGGGKSTLALAIGGYLSQQCAGQTEGRITVDGLDVRQRPLYETADVVGLVQQNPEAQFCTLTVEEEVAFGLENRCMPPPEIGRRLSQALDLVGASHLRHRPLTTLSGGEKQRVAIAAVMAAEPEVLILDEPTSSLDPTGTAEVFGVLNELCQQRKLTVIIIEHKLPQLLPLRPRVVVLEGGRVAAEGPMEQLLPNWGPHWGLGTAIPHSYPTPPKGEQPVVQLNEVDVRYNGRPVLHDLSLSVRPGEVVAVMGDNGAGKSTLLRCLIGLIQPERGRVRVLGHDVTETPTSALAREVGLVFQNPDHQLFANTVWDEAVFASRNFGTLDEVTRARAEALLVRSGLENRRSDHPYRLSYGQKRRLNLASAVVHNPRLLLLDEPLIGQDWANVEFLMDQVQHMAEDGVTVMAVIHDPRVVTRYFDRVIFLEGGRMTADDAPRAALETVVARGNPAYAPTSSNIAHNSREELFTPRCQLSQPEGGK